MRVCPSCLINYYNGSHHCPGRSLVLKKEEEKKKMYSLYDKRCTLVVRDGSGGLLVKYFMSDVGVETG